MHKPLSKKEIKDLNLNLSSNLKPKEIVFALQDVIDPINVGSLFRIADALDAKLALIGQTPIPPHKQISITSRGLDRRVEWERFDTLEECVSTYKAIGYAIIGVELSESAELYNKLTYPDKSLLVLGSEAHGIYKKNLELCDRIVAIPMLGKGPSLNVNTAAAIVGYQALMKGD